MIKKALTYLTILALTTLPVQLISASVEIIGMQMSMSQSVEVKNECFAEAEQDSIAKSCCDEQSQNCQSCNDCPPAISAMFLPLDTFVKISSVEIHEHSTNYLFLDGILQENLLRPPRILI